MATTPLMDVLVMVVPDGVNVVVMALPAESVVVMTLATGRRGPPGVELGRNTFIFDSSAANWVDQASK